MLANMLTAAAVDCAREVCEVILTDAGLPVERCTTPDTLNAVACMVDGCWNTHFFDDKPDEALNGHLGMFAVPIVRLVRLNGHGQDSIPAHVLVAVCDLIHRHNITVRDARRAAMRQRMDELRAKRTAPAPTAERDGWNQKADLTREEIEEIVNRGK